MDVLACFLYPAVQDLAFLENYIRQKIIIQVLLIYPEDCGATCHVAKAMCFVLVVIHGVGGAVESAEAVERGQTIVEEV